MACLLEIQVRELFEPASGVEAGGELVGKRLVVDETVGAGRADRFLVQTLGVQLAPLDAGDLCADQRARSEKFSGQFCAQPSRWR